MSSNVPAPFVEYLPRLQILKQKAMETTALERRREAGEEGLDASIEAANEDGLQYAAQILSDWIAAGHDPIAIVTFYVHWANSMPEETCS